MAILDVVRNQVRSRLNLRSRQLAAERAELEREIDALGKRLNTIIRDQSIVARQLADLDAQPVIQTSAKNPVFALKVRVWGNVAGMSNG